MICVVVVGRMMNQKMKRCEAIIGGHTSRWDVFGESEHPICFILAAGVDLTYRWSCLRAARLLVHPTRISPFQ